MPAAQTVAENVDQVVRNEEQLTERRSFGERIGDVAVRLASTLPFVCGQVVLVVGWVIANSELIPGVPAFDPFPFALLGGLMSLECVFLACFVLMKQAHESRLSERRSHLTLQVNLLVEKEVTKLIQMLERTSALEGTQQHVMDDEARELSKATAVGHFSKELDRRLEVNGK